MTKIIVIFFGMKSGAYTVIRIVDVVVVEIAVVIDVPSIVGVVGIRRSLTTITKCTLARNPYIAKVFLLRL